MVYDFDRLHENQPDKYWAACKSDGFLIGFDARQELHIAFFYLVPDEGFDRFDTSDFDIPIYSSRAEVEAAAVADHLTVSKGEVEFLGIYREWVRIDLPEHRRHYEFHGGELAKVTVSRLSTS